MNTRRLLHSLIALTVLGTAGFARAQEIAGSFANGDAAEFMHRVEVMNRAMPQSKIMIEDRAQNIRDIKAGRKALDAVNWGRHQIGHSAQTLMLLWTLAAIEGIKHEHHLAPLHEKSSDWNDIIMRSGDDLINRTGLYTSMLGGGAMGMAAGYPLAKINKQIHAAVAHQFSAKLLAGSVGSFVTFIGWEAGSRMWEEAIFNLAINDTGVERTAEEQKKLEADIKIAHNLRIFDLARGVGSDDEKRVFAMVLNNVYELLTFTHYERTANWISNTFRLNIKTGEFITIVTTMTVAGTVAGSIPTTFIAQPWLGYVVGGAIGFTGGLAGGIAAHFMPEKNKQRLTDTFRNFDRNAAQMNLDNNAFTLEQIRGTLNFQGNVPQPYTIDALTEALDARVKAREKLGTVLFTQLYDAATKFQEADLNVKIADQLLAKGIDAGATKKVQALRAEFSEVAVKSRGRSEKFLTRLLNLYAAEQTYFGSFLGPKDTRSYDAHMLIEAQQHDLKLSTMMLSYVYAGIFPDVAARLGITDITADNVDKIGASANIYLNQFNMRGFEESLLTAKARGSK